MSTRLGRLWTRVKCGRSSGEAGSWPHRRTMGRPTCSITLSLSRKRLVFPFKARALGSSPRRLTVQSTPFKSSSHVTTPAFEVLPLSEPGPDPKALSRPQRHILPCVTTKANFLARLRAWVSATNLDRSCEVRSLMFLPLNSFSQPVRRYGHGTRIPQ